MVKRISSVILFLLGFIFFQNSLANDNYYGGLEDSRVSKGSLHKILGSYHNPQNNDVDIISDECESSGCYTHEYESYKQTRRYLFGDIFLDQTVDGRYKVTSFYCQRDFFENDFPKSSSIGPMKIPHHTILNTEHSWPQNFFSSSFSKGQQQTDLHALFPVQQRTNSIRGNRPYGDVESSTTNVCQNAFFGKNAEGRSSFEPARWSKGDVARANFYFSVRYKVRIDEIQESYLRLWHRIDPPDDDEEYRNERIFEIQNTRNPFIDHPEWVDFIDDF